MSAQCLRVQTTVPKQSSRVLFNRATQCLPSINFLWWVEFLKAGTRTWSKIVACPGINNPTEASDRETSAHGWAWSLPFLYNHSSSASGLSFQLGRRAMGYLSWTSSYWSVCSLWPWAFPDPQAATHQMIEGYIKPSKAPWIGICRVSSYFLTRISTLSHPHPTSLLLSSLNIIARTSWKTKRLVHWSLWWWLMKTYPKLLKNQRFRSFESTAPFPIASI